MKQTILLIEDDPLSARLADLVLKSEGYQVLMAQNGVEGLKLAHSTPPDLVLLDLMLPGIDGFEVLNRLRSDPQTANVRVVIVSSKSQPTDKETAAKIGADAYVTKPYRKAELLGTVASLLSEALPAATKGGTGVLLVGASGSEAAPVAAYAGLALAGRGEATTVVDLRPFSVEHAPLLSTSPRPEPAPLSDAERARELVGLAVQHASGLRLLDNLEGSGEAGQLTPEDAATVLDALLAGGGFVLADVPLYPVDVLHRVAERCSLIVLVVQRDAAAARAALTLLERAGVEKEQIGVVAVGAEAGEGVSALNHEVLAVVPADATSDDPAYQALAARLAGDGQSSPEGGTDNVT